MSQYQFSSNHTFNCYLHASATTSSLLQLTTNILKTNFLLDILVIALLVESEISFSSLITPFLCAMSLFAAVVYNAQTASGARIGLGYLAL
jgi:hypothetical protein